VNRQWSSTRAVEPRDNVIEKRTSGSKLKLLFCYLSRFLQSLSYKAQTRNNHRSSCQIYFTSSRASMQLPLPAPRKPLAHIRRRVCFSFCTNWYSVIIPNPIIYSSSAQVHYCPARKCSKCLSTAKFESMNLSTQFCMQLSSLPASLPDDIEPVMHFLKQVSVSS
jgi:hypothetical protein